MSVSRRSPAPRAPSLARFDVALSEDHGIAERRSQLEAYREKRGQWLTWLDTDEHHAIWTHLSAMVWTDVSFGTLRRLVVGHEEKNKATCFRNTLIAEQIIQG